jgi:thioester reductase-like protein
LEPLTNSAIVSLLRLFWIITCLGFSGLQIHQGKAFCTEYGKSKFLADRIALQAAAEGLPITIVYPGVLYGPGRLTTGNLVSRIVRETFMPISLPTIYNVLRILWVVRCTVPYKFFMSRT